MSVVIADLVAKIRADTTDVQQGAQAAKQELQGVQQTAEQTSRALEIMAGQFAKLHGGTAADALTMFQKSGVQPTSAAMAEAAKAAQQTAAAVQQVVMPTQAAARAAEDVGKGWTAADSSVVRFGAGVLGVGLGFSLVAGAARLVHDAVTGIVNSQLDWERSLVQVHALYGALGPQVLATAQAQALAPGLAGTAQDFTTAALNARYLSSRYGLPQSDINTLTSAAGRAASTLNLDPATTQSAFLEAVTTGGTQLRGITGTELDPLSVARRLGGTSAAQVAALTPAQLDEVRIQSAAQDAARQAIARGQESHGLFDAQTRAQKVLSEAQTGLANALEGGPQPGIVQSPTTGERALTQQILQYGQASPSEPPQQTPLDPAFTKAVQDAQAAFDAASKAVGDNQKALDDSTAALAKLGVEANSATFKLLGFTGSLEDPRGIARLDVSAQAQSAVASRAVGPNPIQYQSPAEIAAAAMERASQDALKAFIAPTAQASQQQNQAIRQRFTDQATEQGPGLEDSRAAGQAALEDLNRRTAAETARGQAQQASANAQRAQTEAQAQLSTISIQQDERRLSVAVQLAGYRTQALTLEGQLAPIMLQQANLQDRITVAARDSLASRRELIAAQQQQLAATNVTSTYDYAQQRAVAVAQERQARQMLGRDVSDLPTYDELIRQSLTAQIERRATGADVAALDANRNVQVVGQQRTGEQLGRDVTLTGLEGTARGLQDQQIPINQRLRAIQLETDSVQRGLDLRNLEDTKAITVAQRQQLEADSLLLTSEAIARQAGDLAANQDLGATAAEHWAAAMSKGYQAANDAAVSVASIRDMLDGMPSLPTPTAAAAPANGGAAAPGAEYAIPELPVPYNPARVIDTLPGAPMASTLSPAPTAPQGYTTASLPTDLPMATIPLRPAVNPTPDRQDAPVVNAPFTINMMDPEAIIKAATAELERKMRDALRSSSQGGTPASSQLAGARHQ